MFDIGWSEMLVIAVIALVIIGPKDLPRVMKTLGHWMRKARKVSREFQSSIDDMVREAELEDARKAIQSTRTMNLDKMVEDAVDPTGTVKNEVRDLEAAARGDGDAAAKPKSSSEAKAKPDADGEEKRATVIKHPVQQAPPDSVRPPAEAPAPKDEAAPETPPAGKSASG